VHTGCSKGCRLAAQKLKGRRLNEPTGARALTFEPAEAENWSLEDHSECVICWEGKVSVSSYSAHHVEPPIIVAPRRLDLRRVCRFLQFNVSIILQVVRIEISLPLPIFAFRGVCTGLEKSLVMFEEWVAKIARSPGSYLIGPRGAKAIPATAKQPPDACPLPPSAAIFISHFEHHEQNQNQSID